MREKGEAGDAQFRVRLGQGSCRWVRARRLREVVAKLTHEGDEGDPEGTVWEYEGGDLFAPRRGEARSCAPVTSVPQGDRRPFRPLQADGGAVSSNRGEEGRPLDR